MATEAALDLDGLLESLRAMEARLHEACLHKELNKPPLIRVEMALWARKYGPELIAELQDLRARLARLSAKYVETVCSEGWSLAEAQSRLRAALEGDPQ